MNKKFLTYILLIIPSLLFSQITITQSDYTSIFSIGSTNTNSTDTLTESINIGQTGGGNSWDFTNVTAHQTFNIMFIAPSATPYADSFSTANVSSHLVSTFDFGDGSSGMSESWGFFNTSNASNLGSASHTVFYGEDTLTSKTFNFHYPPLLQYNFPLTANKTWSVTDSMETKIMSEGSPTTVSITKSTYNIVIDAWGTMTLPSGKSVEALRAREQSIITSIFFGIPINTITSVTYSFMAKNGESFSILADEDNPATTGTIEGLVSWSNDQVTNVEKAVIIPDKFTLKQNYPNPFNPNTTIEYSITNTELVKLKVFDIIGNEIANLVNEIQSAGNYRYEFNASNFSSGIYFLQINAGNYSDIIKMTLLK